MKESSINKRTCTYSLNIRDTIAWLWTVWTIWVIIWIVTWTIWSNLKIITVNITNLSIYTNFIPSTIFSKNSNWIIRINCFNYICLYWSSISKMKESSINKRTCTYSLNIRAIVWLRATWVIAWIITWTVWSNLKVVTINITNCTVYTNFIPSTIFSKNYNITICI